MKPIDYTEIRLQFKEANEDLKGVKSKLDDIEKIIKAIKKKQLKIFKEHKEKEKVLQPFFGIGIQPHYYDSTDEFIDAITETSELVNEIKEKLLKISLNKNPE